MVFQYSLKREEFYHPDFKLDYEDLRHHLRSAIEHSGGSLIAKLGSVMTAHTDQGPIRAELGAREVYEFPSIGGALLDFGNPNTTVSDMVAYVALFGFQSSRDESSVDKFMELDNNLRTILEEGKKPNFKSKEKGEEDEA